MKTVTRLLTIGFSLAALMACTSVPGPNEALGRPEPVTSPPVAVAQPAAQAAPQSAALPQSAATGYLSPAFRMNARRAAHTATLLSDGTVLVAGGFRPEGTSEVPIATAEIYDPGLGVFTPTGDMNEPRTGHTATLLPNGQVLIVGGWSVGGRTATAELYDPQSRRFRYAASMVAPRASMTATLLPDGRVLIAGGDSARNTPQLIAEIYDPVADRFAQSASLNQGRSAHTATLLNDGNVLFVGGTSGNDTVLQSAEIYHPANDEFTYAGDLTMVRYKHGAVKLDDGDVLVIGGSDQRDWTGKYASAEIYDASSGTFSRITDLNRERFKLADAVVLLGNGNVLVAGGNRQTEIYNAANQRFNLGEELDNDYFFSVVTLLNDGSVLITGGYDARIQPTDQAWRYIFSS